MIELNYNESLSYQGQEGELAKITLLDGSTVNAIYRNGEFVYMKPAAKVSNDGEGITMSMYDLNKVAYAQLPALDEAKIQETKQMIDDFYVAAENNFYMLYGREISYFTLFAAAGEECAAHLHDEVIECLSSVGNIVSAEWAEGAIEFWVVNDNKEATCLYLFPYDDGVVPYGNH